MIADLVGLVDQAFVNNEAGCARLFDECRQPYACDFVQRGERLWPGLAAERIDRKIDATLLASHAGNQSGNCFQHVALRTPSTVGILQRDIIFLQPFVELALTLLCFTDAIGKFLQSARGILGGAAGLRQGKLQRLKSVGGQSNTIADVFDIGKPFECVADRLKHAIDGDSADRDRSQ